MDVPCPLAKAEAASRASTARVKRTPAMASSLRTVREPCVLLSELFDLRRKGFFAGQGNAELCITSLASVLDAERNLGPSRVGEGPC